MKTYSTRLSQVQSRWHVFDASDRILGRLATEISVLLQGKHKPIYARHLLTGDYVVVVNASKIRVTGNKLQQKMYRHHSQYPGGLRETPLAKLQQRYPERVLREAVRGMLPRNTLGRHMLRRLKVYAGESHPHEAQIRASADGEALALTPKLSAEVVNPPESEVQLEAEQVLEVPAEEPSENEVEE